MSKKVRVAIIGVGNCASSFVQGLEYYKHADPTDTVPGLMHVNLGGYHISDIEISAAFDIDSEKVGKDVSEAIFSGLNNTVKFSDVPKLNIPVQRGMTHDGLGKYLSEVITKAPGLHGRHRPGAQGHGHRRRGQLPAGRQRGGNPLVHRADPRGAVRDGQLHAGLHRSRGLLAGALPQGRRADHRRRHQVAGRRDDRASRAHPSLPDRGVEIENTYQLNFGGNTDFLNMLERERLMSKKISKTNSVQSQLDDAAGEGPHPHRSVGLRAVAQRPQVGVHPSRGQVVRGRAAQRRVEARGARLAEQRGHRHRRGALLQARPRPRPERHPRRTVVVLHEVAAASRSPTTRRIARPRSSSPASRTSWGGTTDASPRCLPDAAEAEPATPATN